MKLRRFLLGRKVMTNLDSILKSRDITLPTKVCLVKAMLFLVVMHGCERWTIKNLSGGVFRDRKIHHKTHLKSQGIQNSLNNTVKD